MSKERFVPERLICHCCKREVNCINGWFLCETCTEYQEEVVGLIVKHCEQRGMNETATSIKNGNWAPEDWPPSRPRCAVHGDSMVIDMEKDAVCSICEENEKKNMSVLEHTMPNCPGGNMCGCYAYQLQQGWLKNECPQCLAQPGDACVGRLIHRGRRTPDVKPVVPASEETRDLTTLKPWEYNSAMLAEAEKQRRSSDCYTPRGSKLSACAKGTEGCGIEHVQEDAASITTGQDPELDAAFAVWKKNAERFLEESGFKPFVNKMVETQKNELLTHQSHCCLKHGCKYGESDCPVINKVVVQDYPCENCGESGDHG